MKTFEMEGGDKIILRDDAIGYVEVVVVKETDDDGNWLDVPLETVVRVDNHQAYEIAMELLRDLNVWDTRGSS